MSISVDNYCKASRVTLCLADCLSPADHAGFPAFLSVHACVRLCVHYLHTCNVRLCLCGRSQHLLCMQALLISDRQVA